MRIPSRQGATIVGLSGSSGSACLRGMHIIYIVTTCVAAFVNGYAAFLDFSGAESVKVVADRVRVPRGWMVPLGTLLACGAVGLLTGFAVPVLGLAAAIGLVLYFICAVIAHLRVGDRQIGGPVFSCFWRWPPCPPTSPTTTTGDHLVAERGVVDGRASVVDRPI